MKSRIYTGITAAAAIAGALGMAGAVSGSPVVTASVPMAHCNVIMVGGYSPCFHWPIGPINPGGPIKPAPLTAAS
jgi:hypothetical protein